MIPQDYDIANYQPRYTTLQSIALKVKDKLNILDGAMEESPISPFTSQSTVLGPFGSPSEPLQPFGNTETLASTGEPGSSLINSYEIDKVTILGFLEESEAYLDMYLGQVYGLPLRNYHPILRTCVDSLVISKIFQSFFTLNGVGSSSDVNNDGIESAKFAYQIIAQLMYGVDVSIPGQAPVGRRNLTSQPLILPGETMLSQYVQTFPRNANFIIGTYNQFDRVPQRQREETDEYIHFGIN
jgi:hypothetical protein